MVLLLMAVDRADTAVDCLGRHPLLHVWLLTDSVESTGSRYNPRGNVEKVLKGSGKECVERLFLTFQQKRVCNKKYGRSWVKLKLPLPYNQLYILPVIEGLSVDGTGILSKLVLPHHDLI